METRQPRRVAKAVGDQRDRSARRHPGGAAPAAAGRAAASCSSPASTADCRCRWSVPTAPSKFALEAAADALRMELRPWQIRVAIVEPAQTDTDMWRTADDMVERVGGRADRRAPRPVRQTHRGLQEDDPGVAEDGRTRRRRCPPSSRRRSPPVDRAPATSSAIGPKAAGGRDDEPADEGARSCAAAGIRPAVGCRVRQAQRRGAAEASSPAKPLGCNGFRPLTAVCRAPRVIAYDDTSLTLERLDTVGARSRRRARVRPPAGPHPRRGRRRVRRSRPHGWTGAGLLRAAAAAAADVV